MFLILIVFKLLKRVSRKNHVVHENVVGGSSMIGLPLVIADQNETRQESNLGH
jgi:hypothetical protein